MFSLGDPSRLKPPVGAPTLLDFVRAILPPNALPLRWYFPHEPAEQYAPCTITELAAQRSGVGPEEGSVGSGAPRSFVAGGIGGL